MKFKVGLQLYSVREALKADLAGTLRAVKEMGYDGVEFAGLYDFSAETIRDLCTELDLEPIAAHISYTLLCEDPVATLAPYKTIGIRYAVIPFLPSQCRPVHPEAFIEAIKNIEKIGKAAKELGFTLLYHNHDFEFVRVGDTYGLDLLYETVPAEYLQTELDTCWIRVGGEDPAEYIRKYTGRAPIVHLKDYFGEKSENMYELIGVKPAVPVKPKGFEFRPVGYGLQDFPSILAASGDAGANWVIVEQDQPSMELSALECAQKSLAYLKTLNV